MSEQKPHHFASMRCNVDTAAWLDARPGGRPTTLREALDRYRCCRELP